MSYNDYIKNKEDKILTPSRIDKEIYSKYVILPKRAHDDLNMINSPILYQVLGSLCCFASNKSHRLFVSQAHLSQKMMKHQSTISRQISQLVRFGYVKVLRKGSPEIKYNIKSTHYKILF